MTNVKISEVVAIKVISWHPIHLFYKYYNESEKSEEATVIKKNVLLETLC